MSMIEGIQASIVALTEEVSALRGEFRDACRRIAALESERVTPTQATPAKAATPATAKTTSTSTSKTGT